MTGKRQVPRIVIQRLPLYLRALSTLEGRRLITSQELGEMLGISAAQIRKDLSHFGGFGKQGAGYNVAHLQEMLGEILKVDREWGMALVGVGDLGHAIAGYGGFRDRGFRVAAIFDNDPAKIGRKIGDLEIMDVALLPQVVERMGLQVGIIAAPASAAQKVAQTMAAAGIRAILNYAPITLSLPPEVQVCYIDPLAGLQSMTHYLGAG